MAILYVCSLDHYGTQTAALADSAETTPLDIYLGDGWAAAPRGAGAAFNSLAGLNGLAGTYGIYAPPWGARQGDFALVADAPNASGGFAGSVIWTGVEANRLVIPGALRSVNLIHFAFSISALPGVDLAHGQLVTFLDDGTQILGGLGITPTGRLRVFNGTSLSVFNTTSSGAYESLPVSLAVSAAPVIVPQQWHFLSIKLTTNGDGTADVEVYDGDILPANKVIDATGLAFSGSAQVAQLGFLPVSAAISLVGTGGFTSIDSTIRAVRDIVLCDTTGDYNNDLLGQCFVTAQEMRNEDAGGGWTAYPRENIGPGILDHATTSTGLRFADAAALDIGSSDFTLEGFFRFNTVPGSGEAANLVGKWRAAAGARSYALRYSGSTGALVWDTSTDGAATLTKSVPWTPDSAKWYHVAVSRDSGQTMFFIDGEQIGVPTTDAGTYYDGSAYLGVGVEFDAAGLPETADRFDGWADEIRFTIGSARYNADFVAPTAAFGRSVGADGAFANVVLLLGFDETVIADESSYERAVTLAATDPVTAQTPEDGAASYIVLNQRPPWDDTFIEAALLTASGIFTFDDIPTAAEAITVGATTYTWVSALSTVGPNEVLIGADIDECIVNIIAAINQGTGEGVVYGTGTTANASAVAAVFQAPQFSVIALSAGAAANSVVTTETMADGAFKNATLTGGQDIPDDSDFAIERLPRDTTGVLGVQVTARVYKTDAGSSVMRFDLVGPSAGAEEGANIAPDLSPGWARQIFEEDPDTSAAMTPATLIAGRIRVTRQT